MKQGTIFLLGLLLLSAPILAQDTPKTTDDGKFTIDHEVGRTPVLSQGRTGTCWSFATVSFLESEVKRIHKKEIDLSEMFIVHHAYLEKSERFIRLEGKTQFSEGGLSHDVIYLAKKYGLAPAADFSGLCGEASRHNHGEMAKLLETVVKELAKSKRRSSAWDRGIKGILDGYIGPIPKKIQNGDTTMTPKQFAKEVVALPYDDYREVMSYQSQPFWREAELLVPDNWMRNSRYLNIPVDDMMESLRHAVSKGYSVALDADVSEKGFTANKGVADLPKALRGDETTDETRQDDFDSRATTDDHLMHIVGMAHDKDNRRFYIVKNSWGAVGPYKGYLFMSEDYLRSKMLSFMVHKDGIPKGIHDAMKKAKQSR